jgi:hypothetical protein
MVCSVIVSKGVQLLLRCWTCYAVDRIGRNE